MDIMEVDMVLKETLHQEAVEDIQVFSVNIRVGCMLKLRILL